MLCSSELVVGCNLQMRFDSFNIFDCLLWDVSMIREEVRVATILEEMEESRV